MKTVIDGKNAVWAVLASMFFVTSVEVQTAGAAVAPSRPAAVPEKATDVLDGLPDARRKQVWADHRGGQGCSLVKREIEGKVRYCIVPPADVAAAGGRAGTEFRYADMDELVRDLMRFGQFTRDVCGDSHAGEEVQKKASGAKILPLTPDELEKLKLSAGKYPPAWKAEDVRRYYLVRLESADGKVRYRGSIDLPPAGLYEKEFSWEGWETFDDVEALERLIRRWNGAMIPVIVDSGYFRDVPKDAEVSFCPDEEWDAICAAAQLPVDIVIGPEKAAAGPTFRVGLDEKEMDTEIENIKQELADRERMLLNKTRCLKEQMGGYMK